VSVEQLHMTNSPSWNLYPHLRECARIHRITLHTNGINPESCRNSRIDMVDDCAAQKSGIDEIGIRAKSQRGCAGIV
jgi:polygalacturonase